jgi:hypothetical protein
VPFSFLNPWFWLGALALAAPVWLHLRRKQETNILPFSAVRFLEDQPEPRRAPLRITRLLLFSLRAIACLFIISAFAWPYVRGARTFPIRESRVYILDNTLSRQANDGFVRDRDRLVGELANMGNEIQASVIELRSVPRLLASFADGHETARLRLQELQPSFERGSYLAAFRLANSTLANALGQKRRIILLGDNQDNQWSENVGAPPFLRDVELELPKASVPVLPNLSLSEPHAQRVFVGEKSLVYCTIKLHHRGDAKTATIALTANGETVFSNTLDLANQPETILLQAQWEANPTNWIRGEATVEGTPDALSADNRVFFSLPPVMEGKIALLTQSRFLRLALSQDIMRGRWATQVLDPATPGAMAAAPEADVLCLESGYLQSGEARQLLWQYLKHGRGVLLLVNRVTPGISGYLRELGFESEGTVQASKDRPEMFQFVVSNHPIFHPFLSPDYGSLLDIKVMQFVRLRATSAMPLIVSRSGAGLFFEGTKFPGKLFVCAFGLDREQSSWPIHQSFIPFLDLTLQAARSVDASPTSFEPDETGILQFNFASKAQEAVLRQEGREVARAPIVQGRTRLRMPDKPGLYAVTCDDRDEPEKMLSVNPSPKESELVFVNSPEAIKSWQWPRKPAAAQPAEARAGTQIALAGVLQQQLWWWMVLGGLLVLLFEMALAEPRKESR